MSAGFSRRGEHVSDVSHVLSFCVSEVFVMCIVLRYVRTHQYSMCHSSPGAPAHGSYFKLSSTSALFFSLHHEPCIFPAMTSHQASLKKNKQQQQINMFQLSPTITFHLS